MKVSNKYLSMLAAAVIVAILITSCEDKKEVEKSAQEKFTEQIIGTWAANSVEVDGINLSDFESFTLTLADGSYTTANGNGIWPAQGTWEYTGAGITSITRDDGIDMAIRLVDDNTLELKFTYSVTGGRVLGINDNYVFTLIRE